MHRRGLSRDEFRNQLRSRRTRDSLALRDVGYQPGNIRGLDGIPSNRGFWA